MLCPICKKPVDDPRPGEPAPRPFPFCSDRCKLIDLGRWLGGKYQVPVEMTRDDSEDDAPPPPRPPH
jgi:endogenous inhibitor of DNA gyrase (YacG/DUF329 family)